MHPGVFIKHVFNAIIQNAHKNRGMETANVRIKKTVDFKMKSIERSTFYFSVMTYFKLKLDIEKGVEFILKLHLSSFTYSTLKVDLYASSACSSSAYA